MLPTLYNQYLIDLLMLVKKVPAIRKALSAAGHKAISPDAPTHIDSAVKSLFRTRMIPNDEDGGRDETCRTCLANASLDEGEGEGEGAFAFALSFEPLSDISLKDLLDGAEESSTEILSHVYTLATLAAVYHENDDALAGNVVKILSRAQSSAVHSDEVLQAIDGILEDDIVQLLEKVSATVAHTHAHAHAQAGTEAGAGAAAEGGGDPINDILEKMKDSKIASIAEEISNEIDLGSLGDMNGGINFADLTNANSPLGSLVGKVGSTIQKKMASGELNQADLLREACNFFSAANGSGLAGGGGGGGGMGGMGGIADIMSMMNGMGGMGGGGSGGSGPDLAQMARAFAGTPMGRRTSTQDRLRRKLAQKASKGG